MPAIASTRGEFTPSASPDGRRIAFLSDRAGDWQIWMSDPHVVPAAGGELAFADPKLPNRGYPRFSRDGRWIYFAVFDDEARVWKMPADGGEAIQVTTRPAVASIQSRDGRDLL